MSVIEERAVESGQFSHFGQTYHLPETTVGAFEPGQLEQLTVHGRLYVVADGIGGATSGAVAGRYVVKKILHDFYRATEPDLEKRLRTVIQRANTAVYDRNQRYPDRRAMATTAIVAVIHRHKLIVASVGDSRAYVVWDKDIEHLTGENSPVKKSVGELAAASGSAEKPVTALIPLTRDLAMPQALGFTPQVEVKLFSRRLFPGDSVVLCSGGVTGYLSESEIARTVTNYSPEQASRRLAELVHSHGSRDNISISITRVLDKAISPVALTPKELPGLPDWEALTKPPLARRPPHQTQPLAPLPRTELAGSRPRRRWPIYASLLVILALLGLASFLSWQYFLNGSDPSSWLSEAGGSFVSEAGSPISNATEAPASSAGTAITSTSQLQATLIPQSTMVTEASSPLPTPVLTATAIAGAGINSAPPTSAGATTDTVRLSPATPTPARPQPTPVPTVNLPPGCTNQARFAGDRTVEDGQEFPPGDRFDKVWAVANYGTCPWGGGYTVRFIGGDSMGAPEEGPVVMVEPGATGIITVSMVAPLEDGTHRGTWQLHSPAGEPFGPEMYVEINVIPGALPAEAELTTIYDFVANAPLAIWSSGDAPYNVLDTTIDRNLAITAPLGIVARGQADLRGDFDSSQQVLLTHPHQELGIIEGVYPISPPLQPTDVLLAVLGLPRPAILNDDGVTFEVTFTPTGGREEIVLGRLVQYQDSPVTISQPLSGMTAGQTGVFTLRALAGESVSYDWATWIDLRIVRP